MEVLQKAYDYADWAFEIWKKVRPDKDKYTKYAAIQRENIRVAMNKHAQSKINKWFSVSFKRNTDKSTFLKTDFFLIIFFAFNRSLIQILRYFFVFWFWIEIEWSQLFTKNKIILTSYKCNNNFNLFLSDCFMNSSLQPLIALSNINALPDGYLHSKISFLKSVINE